MFIIQKEYSAGNVISTTYIDGIERFDIGKFDDGTSFCNVYKANRKKEDDFETIRVEGFTLYILNSDGKTLRAIRSKR